MTLTGVGGVGKTRLALEVAAQLADEFPDGVWFFELAAVADPAAVPDAVAAVLGITQQPGKSVSESWPRRWRAGRGCWCSTTASTSLTASRIWSRRSSRLGDRDGFWPPAAKESGSPTSSCGGCPHWTSVRNRIGRRELVRRTRPKHGVGLLAGPSGEAAAVVEICRRLDGIPLAIELAASRMASMTASEVRDRLDHRFRLLVGSRRGLERHQTLRHAVAWSYDLPR